MDGITIKGRGWHEPQVTVTTGQEGVTIRVDDARYDEIWAELKLSPSALAELLGRVCVHLGADGAHLVPLLDRLVERIPC